MTTSIKSRFEGYKIQGILVNINPANIYLFKVIDRNSGKRCEIYSKLTIKMPERRPWRRPGTFVVNFEHISHLFSSVSIVSIVNFEQVNVRVP